MTRESGVDRPPHDRSHEIGHPPVQEGHSVGPLERPEISNPQSEIPKFPSGRSHEIVRRGGPHGDSRAGRGVSRRWYRPRRLCCCGARWQVDTCPVPGTNRLCRGFNLPHPRLRPASLQVRTAPLQVATSSLAGSTCRVPGSDLPPCRLNLLRCRYRPARCRYRPVPPRVQPAAARPQTAGCYDGARWHRCFAPTAYFTSSIVRAWVKVPASSR
jgi:hypothetical protein